MINDEKQLRLPDILSSDSWTGDITQFIKESPYPYKLKQDIPSIVNNLKKRPWRHGEYRKENWGNKLHAMAPFIGRMKTALAHWLVRICSKIGDVVLDPFCGIGTVPLECDFLGRRPIAFDLNPYAVAIARAKFDRHPLKEHIDWLKNVKLDADQINLDEVSPFIKKFYHEKTLRELLALKEKIVSEKKEFLLGCLLGICHGHRPQYLSAWTGYIVPFEPRSVPPYKEVIPRMIAKVKRMYEDGFPLQTRGKIFCADARKVQLPENSIDIIISSPPYFDTIDYVGSNKLRLALLGYEGEAYNKLQSMLIQREDTYLREMEKVGRKMQTILRDGSLCVFVLGDLQKPNYSRNTAQEVGELFEKLGFKMICIIEDEIPIARRTALKWGGKESLKYRQQKFDRILVMQLHK